MGFSGKPVIHLPITWDNERQQAKVQDFLTANPSLSQLLTETIEQIGHYFQRPQFNLEHAVDPEDGFQQLLLTINTDLNADEAIERFEQFRDDWWLDNLQRSELKLVIGLNYRDV